MSRQANKQTFLNSRQQMFVMFLIPALLLAAWSLSAFWEHIDQLRPTYQLGAKIGAAGGEAMLIILIWQKCFSVHLGVRKWALILAFLFAAFILMHTSALRGLGEAAIAQNAIEDQLTERLTQMSKEQAGAIQPKGGNTRRERLAGDDKAKKAQTEVLTNAQEMLAKEIANREDKIKDQSIMPRWYLDGWMYGAIFIAGLLCMSITGWLMMNREDIDADYDGIPDHQQRAARPIATTAIQEDTQRRLEPGPEEFPRELPESNHPNAPRR